MARTFHVCIEIDKSCHLLDDEETEAIYRELLDMAEKIIGKTIMDDDMTEDGLGWFMDEDEYKYYTTFYCDLHNDRKICLEVIK